MPSGARIRANNVFGTTTDNPLLAAATTLNSAGLANLPAVSSAHSVIVLDPFRTNGAPEIVVVTAHTGSATSATIARGQYGTAARQHPSGTFWIHGPITDDFTRVLTSSTRPSSSDRYEGQLIYETDTDSFVGFDGSAWKTVAALGAWTSYTPAVTQGVAVATTASYSKYVQQGRKMQWNFRLDVTGAGTAGSFISLPVPVAAANTHAFCGAGNVYDASAGIRYSGEWLGLSTTAVCLVTDVTANTAWGGTPSIGLANGDQLWGSIAYETAT